MKLTGRTRQYGALFSIVLLGVALWVLRNELVLHSWAEIQADLTALPTAALMLAVALTGANYLVLTGYDVLSVRYAGVALPYRRVALASTLGFALSQALGFPLLTGAPLRLRLYGRWGVEGVRIAKIVAFSSVTFWVGAFGIGGALMTFTAPLNVSLAPHVVRAVGVAMLAGAASYVFLAFRRVPALRIASVELPLPSPTLVGAQIGLTAADWLVSASVLYVLLPPELGLTLLPFASIFIAAQLLGVVSHVPGGLGVFEATLLTLMPEAASSPSLFAALVVYRLIYYLLPLLMAVIVLVATEVYERRHRAAEVGSAVVSVLPTALAALVFVLGASLLLLGATPLSTGRTARLAAWVHPAAVNLSHFMASLVGALLVILARGLQRRLNGAYHLALGAVGVMTIVALTAFAAPALGMAFALAGLLLWSTRDHFYRRSSLLDQPFTPGWTGAIAIIVTASIWLGLFSFKDVAFSQDLWWRFTLQADAPRFLRGSVGVTSFLLLFAIARLLRPTPQRATPATAEELDRAAALVRQSPRAGAHLALLGDKSLLFSESGRSFIMYGIQGSSWISLGDPVGDPGEFSALLWDFRERADKAGDKTAFYQVTPPHLHLYVDLGMSMFKIGEEGRVPLVDMTLEGKKWADLRQARNRFEKMGADFAILSPEEVTEELPALRRVSDEWLASKSTREKGFSLGRFEDDYIRRNPVAVVRFEGKIVAFASMFAGERRDELSVDLMRHSDDAPKGSMDCLFGNLLVWGSEQGYQYFCLGMAPLAGLDDRRLAPLWHRFGDAVYDHGERFYNFQGLHSFKEKFTPEWEPRYLAVPSMRHLPQTLADIAALVGGGLRGVLGK